MKWLLVVACACLAVGFAIPAGAAEVKIGEKAADFKLTDVDGKEFDLAAFVAAEAKKDEKERVKAVTLIFWSLQCPSGVACTKRIKAMAEDSKGKPVLVLGVNSNVNESGEAWKEYLRKAGADVRVLMDADGAVARQFGAKAVTTTVVLDGGGVLRYWGAIDNGKDLGQDGREAYVENAMKAISEGKEVTPAKTSPKG